MKIAILGFLVALMILSGACMAVDTGGSNKVSAEFVCPTTFTTVPASGATIDIGTVTPGTTVYTPAWALTATMSCCGPWSIAATTTSGSAAKVGKMTTNEAVQPASGFLLTSDKWYGTYGYLDMQGNQGVVVNYGTGTAGTDTKLNFGQGFSYDDTPGSYWINVVLTATTSW